MQNSSWAPSVNLFQLVFEVIFEVARKNTLSQIEEK